MLMNAPEKQITVTMTPRARIPKDHSSARVIKDIVEMESLAQVCFFYTRVNCTKYTLFGCLTTALTSNNGFVYLLDS